MLPNNTATRFPTRKPQNELKLANNVRHHTCRNTRPTFRQSSSLLLRGDFLSLFFKPDPINSEKKKKNKINQGVYGEWDVEDPSCGLINGP